MSTYIYPGALHIHTRHSDGSGSFPEVIAAAREAGLRWIIVTDHNTLAGRDYAGWHDGVLVIVDHEITPPRNHFLALNVDEVIDNKLPPQDFVDAVYARGGFGIIAHPDERVKNSFKDIYRWDDWSVDGPRRREGKTVGIEIWNLMSDWAEQLTDRNKQVIFFLPRLALNGPSPATLAWWDRLNSEGRRSFAVGGVDVHAFKHRAPWGEVEVFSYRWMFGTLTNYLLLDAPLHSDPQRATAQVYAALAAGRSYFVNRLDGEAPGLLFAAERAGAVVGIGAEVSLAAGPLTFKADVGRDALLRLIRDGQIVTSAVRQLRHSIVKPGVYRLEAYVGGRPWLYSNPIYVTA
jgi:hypothetical protein